MEIEFDAAKDETNRRLRNLSLALGFFVLENRVVEFEDIRRDYGETRINCLGTINGRLFAMTYTMRGSVYRIISLRKASTKEQKLWQPPA